MPAMKIIKRRISSVNSTKQIMKAMNLVATTKMQLAKKRMSEIRPMFEEIKQMMDAVTALDNASDSIYVKTKDKAAANSAYLVITGDRGLCGGYNQNVAKTALLHMDSKKTANSMIFTAGNKGFEYFSNRHRNIQARYTGVSENAKFEDAAKIGAELIGLYNSGAVDEIYVAYTEYESVLSHIPRVVKILPLEKTKPLPDEQSGEKEEKAALGRPETVVYNETMIYDPDFDTFINEAIPLYLNVFLYGAMVESSVCELASRMTSMDTAVHNAEEIIGDLTLVFNRTRQAIITQEISEIVGGANALQ